MYSKSAMRDIDEIYEYIAYKLRVVGTAHSQINRIIQGIDSLEYLPNRYKIYDEELFLNQELRSFSVDDYMVFYNVVDSDKIVRIVRVIYGGRDMRTELIK